MPWNWFNTKKIAEIPLAPFTLIEGGLVWRTKENEIPIRWSDIQTITTYKGIC